MGSEHRTDEMRRTEFAHTCIALIRKSPMVEKVTFNAATFSLAIRERGASSSSTLELWSCYTLYNETEPARRAEVLERYVRVTSSPARVSISPEEFRASLRPSIQNLLRLEVESLAGRIQNPQLPPLHSDTRPLCEDLVIGLGQQVQDDVVPVAARIRELYMLDTAAAHEIALKNFRRDHGDDLPLERDGDLYLSNRGDGLDAARLLFLPQWLHAQGWRSLVACVPCNDLLLVANPESERGLWQMLDGVSHVQRSGRELLCARPLTLSEGVWSAFESNVMLARMFQSIYTGQVVDFYAHQKRALEALCKSLGRPCTVGEVSLKKIGEEWLTVASWTKVSDLLLPKADLVAFVDSTSGRRHLAPWRKMQITMYDNLQRTDWRPELHQVTGFPTLEQLRKMKAESTPLDA